MRFILASAVCVGSAFGGLLAVVFLVRFACLITGIEYEGEARILALLFGILAALMAMFVVGISDAATEAADAIMAKLRKSHRETRV